MPQARCCAEPADQTTLCYHGPSQSKSIHSTRNWCQSSSSPDCSSDDDDDDDAEPDSHTVSFESNNGRLDRWYVGSILCTGSVCKDTRRCSRWLWFCRDDEVSGCRRGGNSCSHREAEFGSATRMVVRNGCCGASTGSTLSK